jgi:PAS domain S-box-containing protein
MQDEKKSKKQLLADLQALNERVKELETAEMDCQLAKAALRKSEILLRKVFESSPDLLTVLDKDLRIIRSNWHGVHENVSQEIRGQNPFCYDAFYPGRNRPCESCHVLEVFNTGRPAIAEKFNPNIGHVEVHAYPLFDDSGCVGLVVEQVINITGRKQADEAMLKSNQRLDLLAETASQLLKSDSPQKVVNALCQKVLDFLDCDAFFNYLVDDEKKRLHLNACGGIPEEDAGKMEWLDYGVGLCGCSARDGCRLVVEDVQETKDQYTGLVRQFGIRAYACHPLIVQEKVLGTLSFCARNRIHFTEDELSLMKAVADQVAIAMSRKRAEEELRTARDELEKRVEERTEQLAKTIDALRVSEKKYRTLFVESKDVVFIVDDHGKLVDINPAGVELLGYTKEELLALDLVRDLNIIEQARSQFRKKLAPAGYINDAELELRKKDGGTVTVIISASITYDDAGRFTGYRGIAHDVTERKLLEQHLLQAQKLESIGLLAGGVAHEFNNLLTGISGYGQIIQDIIPTDDELLQESIGQLLRAAERAAELTKSLLAFGRKQLINPKPLHVDTIIHNTVGLIKRIIGKDIELTDSFSDKKLLVRADVGQMEQVLMNLATNARDAMPFGGHMHIMTREVIVQEGSESNYGVAVPGIYAMISVSDTGTGIDKKSLERVFEPFYTTKEIGKGTGLGLSIIYGIVKQNNGSVHIESEPDKGTTVTIYLPTIE